MGVRHDRSKPGRPRCGDIIAGDGLILTEVDGEDLHDQVLLCVRKEQYHLDNSPGSQGAHGLHGFFYWHTKSVPENVGVELLRRISRKLARVASSIQRFLGLPCVDRIARNYSQALGRSW